MTIEEFLEHVKIHNPGATLSQVLSALNGIDNPVPGMARGIANQIEKESTALTVSKEVTPAPEQRQTLARTGRRAIAVQATQVAQRVIKEKTAKNPVDGLVVGLQQQVDSYVEQQAQQIQELIDPSNIAARIMARVAQTPPHEALDLSFELFGGQGDSAGTGDSAIPDELEEFLANVQSKAAEAVEGSLGAKKVD